MKTLEVFIEKKELIIKKRMMRVWLRTVDMVAVRKAIEQFRTRLASVVANGGGAIEHYYG